MSTKFVISSILLRLLISLVRSDQVLAGTGDSHAPALYVFGDSLSDSGNNNLLPSLAKVNYRPYGVIFPGGATGRFTNGRTTADFIAEYMGLPYPPPVAKFRLGLKPVTGLNFASGSCGILPETGAIVGKCLTLDDQMNLFSETVKHDLRSQMQSTEALAQHLSSSIYFVNIGSNDYIENYINPLVLASKIYTPQAFAKLLIDSLSQKLEILYKLGARKLIVWELGPVGCMPSITRVYKHDGKCVEKYNNMVKLYNDQLKIMLENKNSSLPGSTIVHARVYDYAYDTIMNPSKYGFTDTIDPCCVTWLNGTATCVPLLEPCRNMDKYMFWDGYHLTETAYKLVANLCYTDNYVCSINLQQLLQM